MKHAGKLLSAIVASLTLAPAAYGQTGPIYGQTGSAIPRTSSAVVDRSATGGVEVRRVLDQFASCVLGNRRSEVIRLLATNSGSAEQDRELGRLAARNNSGEANCLLNGTVSMTPLHLRGSLYTALVRATYGERPAMLPEAPMDFTQDLQLVTSAPEVIANAQMLNFGSCVIHHDPASARQAILGPAGTPREGAAFTTLMPVLGQCVVQGTTIKLDKKTVIGLLAEAYYREAKASNSAGSN